MKNFFTLFFVAAVLLGANGCSHEKAPLQSMGVTISPVITRVAGLNFETGDRIGLTITRETGVYAENVQMTYNGTVFSASDLLWYASGEASTLTAYYPYRQQGAPAEFSVATDQTGGWEDSDLLGAVKNQVTPSSAAVGMVFRHLMACVDITVTNSTASAVTSVSVGGTVPHATVDFQTQTVAVKSNSVAADIRSYPMTKNVQYRVVIVPQTAALTLAVTTADGNTRTTQFAENTFLQGKNYTVGITVEAGKLVPTLSGEVTDWEVGGELQPKTDPVTPPDAEQEGTMVCCGQTYPTVVLGGREWMAENLRYIPAEREASTGVWYPNLDTDASVVAAYGMLYDVPTAQSLCPEGWRLPTEEDFTELIPLLQEPYMDFIPLAGSYVAAQKECKKYNMTGYLMGGTLSDSKLYKHLCLNDGSKPIIHPGYFGENGVSVRYVRDAKQ